MTNFDPTGRVLIGLEGTSISRQEEHLLQHPASDVTDGSLPSGVYQVNSFFLLSPAEILAGP